MYKDNPFVPDINLYDGLELIRHTYPDQKWIVHKGWYVWNDTGRYGWYMVSIPHNIVSPVFAEYLESAEPVYEHPGSSVPEYDVNPTGFCGQFRCPYLPVPNAGYPPEPLLCEEDYRAIARIAGADVDVPTSLAELSQDSEHRTVTDSDIANWNSKQPAGDYALRSELPTVPTDVSAFNNDSGYLTLATLPVWDGSISDVPSGGS